MYKMFVSTSFSVDRSSIVALYNMYCTTGHYFTLIKHHTVNCHSNSSIGRAVNTKIALPVFAFNCETVNCFKRFHDERNLSKHLCR